MFNIWPAVDIFIQGKFFVKIVTHFNICKIKSSEDLFVRLFMEYNMYSSKDKENNKSIRSGLMHWGYIFITELPKS